MRKKIFRAKTEIAFVNQSNNARKQGSKHVHCAVKVVDPPEISYLRIEDKICYALGAWKCNFTPF